MLFGVNRLNMVAVAMPNDLKIYCPFDDLVCEQFTNDFDASYVKALAGKLCSVCSRYVGRANGTK